MSGPKLPAVRLPTIGPDGEGTQQDGVVLELPPSNKFAFAWPADPTPMVTPVAPTDKSISLSSSDTEASDMSENETSPLPQRENSADAEDSFEFTPTNRLNLDVNPIESAAPPTTPPRLSRAFSMPLPSQLGHLQNPRRRSSREPRSPVDEPSTEACSCQELSLELADSVQMVIQTLLQLSPPQVLDPAKEQFSGCSLSIPTPSISAMFTSMKNLNYMSANVTAFGAERPDALPTEVPYPLFNDFDIGEMLQSVGDAVSGLAAQAGVDLALYHGDVGIRHAPVRGDECGISYALSHIIRQVLDTAKSGDAIEIGLFIRVVGAKSSEDLSGPGADTEMQDGPAPLFDSDGPYECLFDIAHKFSRRDRSRSPDGSRSSASPSDRPRPNLRSSLLRRLLGHIGATLQTDLAPRTFPKGRSCEMSLTLERGDPATVNPVVDMSSEESPHYLYPNVRISNEPTLEQLLQFAETLKGKKAALYASAKGSFAHHLTSYLTAWGLDVSHVSREAGLNEGGEPIEGLPEESAPDGSPRDERAYRLSPVTSPMLPSGSASDFSAAGHPESINNPSPPANSQSSPSPPSFIFIDDDVCVLRERLRKLRSEPPFHLNPLSRKRPTLAAFHRPRSSPQVARAMGFTPVAQPPPSSQPSIPPVIIHFTSLSNFKRVKDAIQSILSVNPPMSRMPEVIVIPKPAGPRRFLTALHTAVTKPIVDPFFSPIATSPLSPGVHLASPFFGADKSPRSPLSRPQGSTRPGSERSNRSPKDHPVGEHVNLPPPSPLGMSDGMEYFSEAAVKLGTSPSSGLVIESSDGSPAAIFFHPKAKSIKPGGIEMVRERGALGVPHDRHRTITPRRTSGTIRPESPKTMTVETAIAALASPAQSPASSSIHRASFDAGKPPSPASDHVPGSPGLPFETQPTSASSRILGRKGSQADTLLRGAGSQPVSPRSGPGTPAPTRRPRRQPDNKASPSGNKKPADPHVVPPISVLIVDDNPINQTILSTFMKKKKIKYDVAKNGQEAVTKWRTGGFHLILMDIQMPVMDGIEATKQIRQLEKANGSAGFPTTPSSEGKRTPSPSNTPSTERSSVNTPYRSSVIIVALTASSLQSDRVAALAAGCNDFLTKPVSLLWLNNKIIEWGSIKALQMWADLRPEVVKSISSGQQAQAQNVARRLHVPEKRSPSGSPSRSSSLRRGNRGGTVNGATKISERPVRPSIVNEDSGRSSDATPTHSEMSRTPEESHTPEKDPGDENMAPATVHPEGTGAGEGASAAAPEIEQLGPTDAGPTKPSEEEETPRVPSDTGDASEKPAGEDAPLLPPGEAAIEEGHQ